MLLSLRRAAVVPLVALALTGLAQAPGHAATPADIATAQQRVALVSGQVARVAVDLSEGTQRWEAGTQELARAQNEAATASAKAAVAAATALARQRTLSEFIASSYRRTSSTASSLLSTASQTGGVFEALRAGADLDRIRGSQAQALIAADAARLDAEAAGQQAQRLRASAAEREQQLAQELTDLTSLADRTNSALQSALGELDRLEAERAAELAAIEAARLESLRMQAARDAAARNAPPPFIAAAVGTGCPGRSTGGYANGTIPASALCPLSDAPGHALRADAAAAFNRLTEASKQARGVPLCVTDSYRDYAAQVAVYKAKPGLAAIPGTSNHGWGIAVDLCGGVESFGSPAHTWLKANAGRFGWVHPAWAEPGGSRPEPWHWEFVG